MADTTQPGAISGLVKSKKYGITFAFVTTCFGFLTQTTSLTLQVALLGASALSVCTYVVSQAILESKPGEAPPEEDAPTPVAKPG